MTTAILELILIGAKIFSSERKNYYEKKAKKLIMEIAEVADSPFYKKDMEAKGKAERALLISTEELRKQFVSEANK